MSEQEKIVSSLNPKQLISIQTEQLLNITITKTGIKLIKDLSSLFTNVYNQCLPESIDENKPMLELVNLTGQNILISNLNGLEIISNHTSTVLQSEQSIGLMTVSDRVSSAYRLSVLEEQNSRNRQEFSIQVKTFFLGSHEDL